MAFRQFHNAIVWIGAKLKQRYAFIFQKLCSNRTRDKLRKLFLTKRHILFYLDDANLVSLAFRLHRKDIVRPFIVQSNINFISLNLTNATHCCTQVILDGITSNTGKDVDKPVVSKFRQQCLFICLRRTALRFQVLRPESL